MTTWSSLCYNNIHPNCWTKHLLSAERTCWVPWPLCNVLTSANLHLRHFCLTLRCFIEVKMDVLVFDELFSTETRTYSWYSVRCRYLFELRISLHALQTVDDWISLHRRQRLPAHLTRLVHTLHTRSWSQTQTDIEMMRTNQTCMQKYLRSNRRSLNICFRMLFSKCINLK